MRHADAGTWVAGIIDTRRLSRMQLLVIGLCSLIVFTDGYAIQTLALAVPSMAQDWGVAPSAFGLSLSASLVGLGLGSAFMAPLGDRLGRRPVLLAGLVLIGLTSLATVTVTSPTELVFWRVLTGVGIGACQSNATALTAEYVPLARRARLMTLMGCNIALGSLVAAFTAPWVIAAGGWQAVFIAGGSLALVLALAIALALPESLRFLVARDPTDARIGRLVGRIAPDADATPPSVSADAGAGAAPKARPLTDLLRPPLRERTLLLWLMYSLNTFLLYLLISWLPTFLGVVGWGADAALRGIAVMQVGGIAGALLMSWWVDRGQVTGVLIGGYGACALAALAFLVVPSDPLLWSLLLMIIGGGVSGATFAIIALGAVFYPPDVRATGFGWAGAVARVGAVLGPLVGGWVLAASTGAVNLLVLLAIPAAICALSALPLRSMLRRVQH